MKTSTKILLGTIAGAAVGVAVGILLAPDHGNNTHKKVPERRHEQ
jgi:gas vesicle protein